MKASIVLFSTMVCGATGPLLAQVIPDAPIDCPQCEDWNRPIAPFRIFGDTYYVGPKGLTVILVASSDGLILIDGALPQSAPLIEKSIEELGFRLDDVKLIVNTHTHFDHAAGIAALQRASGAVVAASPSSALALRSANPTPDDPQYSKGDNGFPPVANVRVIQDGDVLAIGDVEITAHVTPGHTPGTTSWAWKSCEGNRCLDVVYADSLTAVSADGFRFSGGGGRPSIVETFRHRIRTVAELNCDILLSPHPGLVGLEGKLQRRDAGEVDVFVDSGACRAYAASAEALLDQRVAEEMDGSGSD